MVRIYAAGMENGERVPAVDPDLEDVEFDDVVRAELDEAPAADPIGEAAVLLGNLLWWISEGLHTRNPGVQVGRRAMVVMKEIRPDFCDGMTDQQIEEMFGGRHRANFNKLVSEFRDSFAGWRGVANRSAEHRTKCRYK